jgi:hypothetical protein
VDTPLPTFRSLLLRLIGQQNGAVSAEKSKRTTLARLRQTIPETLPWGRPVISYGDPAFNVGERQSQGSPRSRII